MTFSTPLSLFVVLALSLYHPEDVAAQEDSAQGEWNIVALRVDFPVESPDQLSTTGSGQFDLRDFFQAAPDYAFPYDTPPHDRLYFEHHLDALARYYWAVSDGQVAISYQVFPRELETAYTLPQPALTYGNGRTEREIGEKWAQLFADAVGLADDDPAGPDFTAYQSFLVFHAGVGHETGLLNDVRSVYLSAEDLARDRPEPILVDSGRVQIRDGWILPEATSFQGQGGLNGLLAKFFGHQLGLPGLSNFADGLPALGGWSLMDVGANNLGFVLSDSLQVVVGFAPSHPMAWSKAKLGWIEPIEIKRDTTIALVASDRAANLAKAVRIPITQSEYFLLENRQQRGNSDLPDGIGGRYAGSEVVWIDSEDIEFSGANNSGVWLQVREQDAFVPGSGILIWHVDEARIAAGSQDGSINDDPVRPGIVLEEADGYRDIGNPVFQRLSEIEGSANDPFFVGGNERFGSDSVPDSRSNSGHKTGIEVVVLSAAADTMWVEVRFAGRRSGWPLAVDGVGRLQAADSDGDGDLDLLADHDGGVSVWQIENPMAGWNIPGERFLASADADGDGRYELFTNSGDRVSAWDFLQSEALWSREIDGAVEAALVSDQLALHPGRAVLVLAGDGLTILDADDGELLRRESGTFSALTAADLDGDGGDELLAASTSALIQLDEDGLNERGSVALIGDLLSGDLDGDGKTTIVMTEADGRITYHSEDSTSSIRLRGPVIAASIGDVDGDGFLEVALLGDGRLHARRHDLTRQRDFPIEAAPAGGSATAVHAAAMADFNGDGAQDLVVGTSVGLRGFQGNGELLTGFPLLTAMAVSTPAVAADLDGDDVLELAVADGSGIYAWEHTAVAAGPAGERASWGQHGQSAAGTFAHPHTPAPEPRSASRLLPADRVYVYPNPVGGDGPAHLRFVLGRRADVQVEIFDAIGTRVQKLSRGFDESDLGENEIRWATTDYASGLYILRLTADGDDGVSESAMVRLAVIR